MGRFLIKLVATFFFIGYIPLMPGTFGSIAALLIYGIFLKNSPLLLMLVFALVATSGFMFAGRAAKLLGRQDPPRIVIDEACGMLISFLGLPIADMGKHFLFNLSQDKLIIIIGFLIFRVLDIIKPPPADRFHYRSGSLSIMGDDIIAGVYTNIILRILLMFLI